MGIVVVNGQIPIIFVEHGLDNVAANWLIIKKAAVKLRQLIVKT